MNKTERDTSQESFLLAVNTLQFAFHIATTYFDYYEKPSYYTMRFRTHMVGLMNETGLKFVAESEPYSLLDENEVKEMVLMIDYSSLRESLIKIVTLFAERKLAGIPIKHGLVVDEILRRMKKIIFSIEYIRSDKDYSANQKHILVVLYLLNDLFRDRTGISGNYSQLFAYYFQVILSNHNQN